MPTTYIAAHSNAGPLRRARDQTRILMDTSRVHYAEPQWELPHLFTQSQPKQLFCMYYSNEQDQFTWQEPRERKKKEPFTETNKAFRNYEIPLNDESTSKK